MAKKAAKKDIKEDKGKTHVIKVSDSEDILVKTFRFIEKRHFYKSFRFDKAFLYAVLYDLIYYAILIIALGLYFQYGLTGERMAALAQGPDMMQMMAEGQQGVLESEFSALTSAYRVVIASTFLLFITLFLNHWFFKGLIWKTLIGKRYSLHYAWKSIVVTLLMSLIVFLILFFGMKMLIDIVQLNTLITTNLDQYALGGFNAFLTLFAFFALLLMVLLTMHMGYITYPLLAIDNSLKNFFIRFWRQGVVKIYRFIIPYIIITALFIALLLLVKKLGFIPLKIYQSMLVISVIIYLTWSKQYILSLIMAAPEKE